MDNDKHKKIVRSRLIAIGSVAVLACLVLIALIWGIIRAAGALRERAETKAAEEALNETASEEATVVSITDAGLENTAVEEESGVRTSPEDIEEQYDEVVEKGSAAAGTLEIEERIEGMSLEDKVAQLFIISPEQLTLVSQVTQAGEATRTSLGKHHVGGIIYFAANLLNPGQTKELLSNTKEFAKEGNAIPLFLAIDEEGGRVARIALNEEFGVDNVGSMEDIGKEGSADKAYEAGNYIGGYLSELGFNLDFAPVADVSIGSSAAIGDRSFGTDPETVSLMADSYSKGLEANGILSCYKHFPGFGRAVNNTDFSVESIDAGIDELKETDLKPYLDIDDGRMIMAGNMSFPAVTGDDVPACMSSMIITDYLRGELKYNGVVITDALNAAAITEKYDSAEAAVNALKAGVDILLMPADFEAAYNGVLSAVNSGDITEDMIDSSLSRILALKSRAMGL